MSDSYENEISIEEKAKQEIELEAERKQLKKQIKKEKKKQKKQKTPKGMLISSALFFGITTVVGWILFLIFAVEMATLPSDLGRLAVIVLLPVTLVIVLSVVILYIIPFLIGIKGTIRIAKNKVMGKVKKAIFLIYFILMMILPIISDAGMITTLVLVLKSLSAV